MRQRGRIFVAIGILGVLAADSRNLYTQFTLGSGLVVINGPSQAWLDVSDVIGTLSALSLAVAAIWLSRLDPQDRHSPSLLRVSFWAFSLGFLFVGCSQVAFDVSWLVSSTAFGHVGTYTWSFVQCGGNVVAALGCVLLGLSYVPRPHGEDATRDQNADLLQPGGGGIFHTIP